ncbi:pyruvate, water dikinase regulatory protein [Criibacterium bergeronii]|uniref:Putative pyruvate, phosphate dikinase regulatory protein n=1 Tax=Criibacterium bergeronii TaxID=1871336 RepID=A0A371IKR4_9FIRM|nr:pyruvate, water dikinase regulatory protein [Criibacterium bergeronii]MBS6063509.1 kinase/pyrophosphorylase [Peptostreptococcaceae bacterium]RDY21056.1 kinase/pyrophosphorylase [Criibacterium bergeronii]
MNSLDIFILSDSLGNTAEHICKAAVAQFETLDYKIRKFSHVKSDEELHEIFEDVLSRQTVVVLYTIVSEELINSVKEFAEKNKIIAIDLLSPITNSITKLTKLEPLEKPGMLRQLNDLYFKRVESMEFAVKYDDGKDNRGVLQADLVIIGISRTSKTPLSMYLANKNIKVANIPLVPEASVPKELFEISSKKIVGLTNSPEKLNHIRVERLNALGLPNGSKYADMSRILEEIDFAEGIMRKIGCPIINVENKAIEETAELIITYLKKSGVKIYND